MRERSDYLLMLMQAGLNSIPRIFAEEAVSGMPDGPFGSNGTRYNRDHWLMILLLVSGAAESSNVTKQAYKDKLI